MVIVTVKWNIKEEKLSEFLDIFSELAPIVHNEGGCIEYKLYKELDNSDCFLFEKWESKEHLDAHLKTEHMKIFFAQTKDFFSPASDISVFGAENLQLAL